MWSLPNKKNPIGPVVIEILSSRHKNLNTQQNGIFDCEACTKFQVFFYIYLSIYVAMSRIRNVGGIECDIYQIM